MILAVASFVIIILALILFVGYALTKERAGTIADLLVANSRLHEDNRRLTEALCLANGQHVDLKPLIIETPTPETIEKRRLQRTPYFQSKTPIAIQVGEKTVTI